MLAIAGTEAQQFEQACERVSKWLESKSFFAAQRAFRTDLALALQREATNPGSLALQNLFSSDLDAELGLPPQEKSSKRLDNDVSIEDCTPTLACAPVTNCFSGPLQLSGRLAGVVRARSSAQQMIQKPKKVKPVRLFAYALYASRRDEDLLRRQYESSTQRPVVGPREASTLERKPCSALNKH